MRKNIINFTLWYLPVLFVQLFSSFMTNKGISTWYYGLKKSSLTPPEWVFGVVWTVLYFLMTLSIFLVFKTDSPRKKTAYLLFFSQLALNALWPFLFFFLQMPLLALLDLIFLFSLLLFSFLWFYAIRPASGLLLIPYLLWVGYALILQTAIFRLN